MALVLLLILIYSSTCIAYTIEGNSVFMEDTNASLRVTPHTAQYPSPEGYQQEFEICNKTETTTNLFGAYVFNNDLDSGKVEYLVNEDYEWVEYEERCFYEFDYETNVNPAPNIHQAECYYFNTQDEKIIEFDMGSKTGNIETGRIQYDVNELVKTWSNVTSSFEKQEIGEKFAYIYASGKEVLGNSCETWRITYKPNSTDASEKWDLWLWAGEEWNCILTDTCLKTLKLDPWWDSDGSEGDPYIMEDCNSLHYALSNNINNPNVYFELGNNIDCSEYGTWVAIARQFTGNLDGKNYSISNVTINATTSETGALFMRLNGDANIQNLALLDFNVWNSANCATTLSCDIIGSVAYVNNVYVSGATIASGGSYSVAGLIGGLSDGAIIHDCYITDSTIRGAVAQRVGGLAGYADYGPTHIYNNYSTALVNGSSDVGGFIGAGAGATVEDNFWDTQTSGQATSNYATGLTTANMFKEASFTNWDFTDIWTIEEDVNYPTLQSFLPPNTAPTWTSIDLNVSYSQQGGNIKVTATGTADTESDALTLLCGTATNPTVDTNNFCTAYGIASPYTTVDCVGQGASGDAVNTVYCRLYDGTAYSSEKTDTYTADNTTPSVSGAIMNAGSNLIGVDYDLNMTITDAGSGLSGTQTYKCWSSGAGSTEGGGTSADWD